jgi:membrane-bound serine protease (ClpP class)
MEWIISLIVAGFLLIVLEMFLPGLIIGLCGGICLITAVVMTYVSYGVQTGTLTLMGVILGSLIFTIFWMKNFSRFAMGRKLILDRSIQGSSPAEFSIELKGTEGVALTDLRPSGTALIQGKRYDVVTEGRWIKAGTKLKVVEMERNRIIVRNIEKETIYDPSTSPPTNP